MAYVDPFSGGQQQGDGQRGSAPQYEPADPYTPLGQAPQGASASPSYGAPSPYGAPSGSPASAYGAPGSSYGAPAGSPAPAYAATSGYSSQSSYGGGYMAPPRKRKGLKRIIFGAIGIVMNAIGLVVMPVVATFIGVLLSMGSMGDPVSLGATGGTFTAEGAAVYYIVVPAEDFMTVECTGYGDLGATLEPEDAPLSNGEIDGVSYVQAYTLTEHGSTQDVTIECTGASDVAYTSMGVAGTLIGFGVGLLIPVVLGIASLALLIWGIIARVRS